VSSHTLAFAQNAPGSSSGVQNNKSRTFLLWDTQSSLTRKMNAPRLWEITLMINYVVDVTLTRLYERCSVFWATSI
jgi:hypothetical protein